MSISNDNLPKSMRYGLMSANAVQASANLARFSSVNGSSNFSPTGANEIRIKVKANGFLDGAKHYLSFTVTTAAQATHVDQHAGSFFDRMTIEAAGSVVEQIQSYGLYNSIRNTYNCPMDKLFAKTDDKYILMMAIIRRVEDEDEQRKRCKGSIDTLEFSQAVSGSKTCKCTNACTDQSENLKGGGMRAIKYKTLTKKNRKLRKRSQRKKKKKGYSSYKFYSSKSKKRSYRRTRKHKK